MKPCPKCKKLDEDAIILCAKCGAKFFKKIEKNLITPEQLKQRGGLEGIETKPLPRTGRGNP